MSANPRRVLNPVQVVWGEAGCSIWVRAGTVADIPPGSALEAAYGTANLSGIIPAAQRGHADILDRSALAN